MARRHSYTAPSPAVVFVAVASAIAVTSSPALATPGPEPRPLLRARLIATRDAFAAGPIEAERAALAHALCDALARLEPECLGLYCPLGSEFNVRAALAADRRTMNLPLAIPFARKQARTMAFRRWDGAEPALRDECGIGSSDGAEVVPDVAVVPCVGFTADGHRLGYGGGYYDRWLAAHPQTLAVGLAWSSAEIDAALFAAQPHDIALAFIVTERGVR